MKTLRYLAIVYAALTLASMAFAEELTTLVDARRSGGTSTGTFVNTALPSFVLAPNSGTFGIQSASSILGNRWEFAIGTNNQINLSSNPTVSLSEIFTFRSASSIINDAGISYSSDRFNPTDVRYLFARTGATYYAFEVAKWSNNGQANPSGDRLRFYRANEVILDTQSATLSVVPEPTSALIFTFGIAGLALRRRR
jgi:hypothetical protein